MESGRSSLPNSISRLCPLWSQALLLRGSCSAHLRNKVQARVLDVIAHPLLSQRGVARADRVKYALVVRSKASQATPYLRPTLRSDE